MIGSKDDESSAKRMRRKTTEAVTVKFSGGEIIEEGKIIPL